MLPDLLLLRANAQPLDGRLAARLMNISRQHLQRCGLPRAVDPEESETLASRNPERQRLDGHLWADLSPVHLTQVRKHNNIAALGARATPHPLRLCRHIRVVVDVIEEIRLPVEELAAVQQRRHTRESVDKLDANSKHEVDNGVDSQEDQVQASNIQRKGCLHLNRKPIGKREHGAVSAFITEAQLRQAVPQAESWEKTVAPLQALIDLSGLLQRIQNEACNHEHQPANEVEQQDQILRRAVRFKSKRYHIREARCGGSKHEEQQRRREATLIHRVSFNLKDEEERDREATGNEVREHIPDVVCTPERYQRGAGDQLLVLRAVLAFLDDEDGVARRDAGITSNLSDIALESLICGNDCLHTYKEKAIMMKVAAVKASPALAKRCCCRVNGSGWEAVSMRAVGIPVVNCSAAWWAMFM